MSSKKKSSSESVRTPKPTRAARSKSTPARKSTPAAKRAEPVLPTLRQARAEDPSNVTESGTALARTTANIAALRKQLEPATGRSARKSSVPRDEVLERALEQLEAGYRNLLGGT